MKKVVLLYLLLLLLMGHLTYAQVAAGDVSTPGSSNIKLELKLGSDTINGGQLGIWGGYSWNQIWGARMGVLFTESSNMGTSSSSYFTVPILLSIRPYPEKKISLFGGIQLGYRLKIHVSEVVELNKPMKAEGPDEIKRESERRKQLKDKLMGFDKDKTPRLQVGLVAGADFEFSFGLTIGLYGVKYLIDPGKGTCYDDWKLHPSWTLFPTIGYNLVRIYDFLRKN